MAYRPRSEFGPDRLRRGLLVAAAVALVVAIGGALRSLLRDPDSREPYDRAPASAPEDPVAPNDLRQPRTEVGAIATNSFPGEGRKDEGTPRPTDARYVLAGRIVAAASTVRDPKIRARLEVRRNAVGSDYFLAAEEPRILRAVTPALREVAFTALPADYRIEVKEVGHYDLCIRAEGVFGGVVQEQSTNADPLTVELRIIDELAIVFDGSEAALVAAVAAIDPVRVEDRRSGVAEGPTMWRIPGPLLLPAEIEIRGTAAGLAPWIVPVAEARTELRLGELLPMTVEVRERGTDIPIGGALVRVQNPSGSRSSRSEARTDPTGKATLPVLRGGPGATTVKLSASAAGFTPEIVVLGNLDAAKPLGVTLARRGRPGGVLRDPHGNPIVGAAIFLPSRNGMMRRGMTDDAGRFDLRPAAVSDDSAASDRIPRQVAEIGCSLYVVTPDGHRGLVRDVSWNELQEGTFNGVADPITLRLRVVDTRSRDPLAKLGIRLVPRLGSVPLDRVRDAPELVTDASGRVEFPVIAEATFVAEIADGDFADAVRVPLEGAGASEATVAVALPTSLRLRCVDGTQAPIGGLLLSLHADGHDFPNRRTDDDGRVLFRVPEGLRVTAVSLDPAWLPPAARLEPDASSDAEREVVLRRRVRTELRIVSTNGTPVPRAIVAVLQSGESRATTTLRWTADDPWLEHTDEAAAFVVYAPGFETARLELPSPNPGALTATIAPGPSLALALASAFPPGPLTLRVRLPSLDATTIGPLSERAFVTAWFSAMHPARSGAPLRIESLTPADYELELVDAASTSLWRHRVTLAGPVDLGEIAP